MMEFVEALIWGEMDQTALDGVGEALQAFEMWISSSFRNHLVKRSQIRTRHQNLAFNLARVFCVFQVMG